MGQAGLYPPPHPTIGPAAQICSCCPCLLTWHSQATLTPVWTGPKSPRRPPHDHGLPGQALGCLRYKALASNTALTALPAAFLPPLHSTCGFLPPPTGANDNKLSLVSHPCHVAPCLSDHRQAAPTPCLPQSFLAQSHSASEMSLKPRPLQENPYPQRSIPRHLILFLFTHVSISACVSLL